MFPRQVRATEVEEDPPVRSLFILEVLYEDKSVGKHLVQARSETDAIAKLNRHWEPSKPILGFKTTKCADFETVILGTRRIL